MKKNHKNICIFLANCVLNDFYGSGVQRFFPLSIASFQDVNIRVAKRLHLERALSCCLKKVKDIAVRALPYGMISRASRVFFVGTPRSSYPRSL